MLEESRRLVEVGQAMGWGRRNCSAFRLRMYCVIGRREVIVEWSVQGPVLQLDFGGERGDWSGWGAVLGSWKVVGV